ncbi:DNA primase [Arthrobacter sp. Hiyo8]|nr:DNA primase [Arthrobacter sp. Hiyo8]
MGLAAEAPARTRVHGRRIEADGDVFRRQPGHLRPLPGRLIWPIRDIAGDTIGFGARKLYEDDQGPKYLNTPETVLYKKSQVLYGIDLAKRNIAKDRQLVVVEGYTDVMACHLAGVGTAVATCGTAFGTDHIKIARRLLSDDGTGGEVIFTFDGDAAGQKAALRAFEEDQRFVAQTYVAVEPSGADPCDLRQLKGDAAVRDLIGTRRPLFEFAIRASLKRHNLDTVEGRVAALRESAPSWRRFVIPVSVPPMSASWQAGSACPSRKSAGPWAWPPNALLPARRAIQELRDLQALQEPRARARRSAGQSGQPAAAPPSNAPIAFMRPDPRDPIAAMERQALEVVIQNPALLGGEAALSGGAWERFEASHFVTPAYSAVHTAIRAAGLAHAGDPVAWVEGIRQEVPEPLQGLVSELAVVPLPASTSEALQRYCRDILARLFELQITRVKADKMGQLQRLDASAQPEEFQRLNRELMQLEMQRRALRMDS